MGEIPAVNEPFGRDAPCRHFLPCSMALDPNLTRSVPTTPPPPSSYIFSATISGFSFRTV